MNSIQINTLPFIAFGVLWFSAGPLLAQIPEWEEGEIEDTEVIIEKDREIVLPFAARTFDKIPPWELQTPSVSPNYQFKSFDFKPTPFIPLSRFTPQVTAESTPPTKNLIKAGYGNFGSPLAEAYLQTNPSNWYSAALDLRHLSFAKGPVDGKNSGSSDTDLNLGGKVYGDKVILSGDLGYQFSKVYFYGYNPVLEVNRDTIEQNYHQFKVDFGLKQADNEELISYNLNLKFNRTSDSRFSVSENDFLLNLDLGYQVSDALGIHLDTDLHFITFNNFAQVNRNFYRFLPYAKFKWGNLTVDGGARLVKENGNSFNEKSFHIYPVAKASYAINKEFHLFAGIDGDLELVNYRSLVNENRHLLLTNILTNSNKKYDLFAGIKGGVAARVNYEAGISYRDYENLYFYVNNAADSTGFNLIYDNAKVFNFYGSVGIQTGSTFHFTTRFDYFNYSLENLVEAWHRPNYQLSLLTQYQPVNALNLGAEIYFIGGITGLNQQSSTQEKLKDIFDLSLSADYLITRQFGAFVTLNNLLSRQYERYLNYENRGLMIHVGASFTF